VPPGLRFRQKLEARRHSPTTTSCFSAGQGGGGDPNLVQAQVQACFIGSGGGISTEEAQLPAEAHSTRRWHGFSAVSVHRHAHACFTCKGSGIFSEKAQLSAEALAARRWDGFSAVSGHRHAHAGFTCKGSRIFSEKAQLTAEAHFATRRGNIGRASCRDRETLAVAD